MIWAFLIYLLTSFVASYVLVEYGQKYLYDEVPPYVAVKVSIGALVMAGFMTWLRPAFETMFTETVPYTLLMAMAWVGVFVLIYRFQPLHGLGFALAAVLILPGLATMAVQGMTAKRPDPRTQFTTPAKPLRRGTGSSLPPLPASTPAPGAK